MVLTAEQHHPNIKIFVSAHKQATFPEGNSIVPVQVGAANAVTRFTDTLHDDEGVNISAENPRYCELTAQYWAWKNEDADYYGFCHYRIMFAFVVSYQQMVTIFVRKNFVICEHINYFLQNVQIFVLLFNFFEIFFELICGFDYIFHLSKSSNNSSALL